MKKITQEEFDKLPIENGIKICPGNTDYSNIKVFAGWCSFADGCSFAEGCSFAGWCSFAEWCSFKQICNTILLSQLGKLPDKITLELMRRDAQFHPDPKKFDEWAKGGACPYSNSNCITRQIYNFDISRELWKKGKPTMSEYDLFMAIAKEKNWKIG